jgi:hypothetical protein
MSVVRITVAIDTGNIDKGNMQNLEESDQKRLSIRAASIKGWFLIGAPMELRKI